MNFYTVFKRTGTHADALAAIGAADLLKHLSPEITQFNAVSGDMFKHIYVAHLTTILQSRDQPLSAGAEIRNPDRITIDQEFKSAIKGLSATEVQSEMLARCAVTDIAGALLTEGVTVARKSCAEFGWVVGVPDKVHTEQYFHVKYDNERRGANQSTRRGEGTIAGSQAIFHRPAN